ncbi:MAG: DUF1513 domain-containing protein [Bdellovibrionota bacterium]
MSMGRRDLLKILGSTVLLHSCLPVKKESVLTNPEMIYSGFRMGAPYVSTPAGLVISSPMFTEKVTFANEIHSIIYSRELKLKVFVSKLELLSYGQFENGPYTKIHADEGNYFYGHGVIDEKRKLFYSTQAKVTKDRDDGARGDVSGFVYVHSLPDFKIVDKFPTFGNDPHDMKLINDQLIICNGGSDSSITFIDLPTRKLVREFKVNVPHLSLRHIEQVDEQNFIIATLTSDLKKTTPLYGLNLQAGLRKYPTPVEIENSYMRSQLLSVIHHGGYIYATCPATHTVLIWDRSGNFLGGQKIKAAAGLAVSGELNAVVVSSGDPLEPAKLLTINNGSVRIQALSWATGLTGSHATVVNA